MHARVIGVQFQPGQVDEAADMDSPGDAYRAEATRFEPVLAAPAVRDAYEVLVAVGAPDESSTAPSGAVVATPE